MRSRIDSGLRCVCPVTSAAILLLRRRRQWRRHLPLPVLTERRRRNRQLSKLALSTMGNGRPIWEFEYLAEERLALLTRNVPRQAYRD